MFNLHLIGAGSLGSHIAIEAARRAAALSLPLEIFIYDDDLIERRNVFSQDFLPEDIGKSKASVVADKVSQYDGIKATPIVERIDASTAEKMALNSHSIIIDAVDNLPTRHFLWFFGIAKQVPVQHVGMAVTGTGEVGWSVQGQTSTYDTFSLSPMQMSQNKIDEQLASVEKKMPPCELNSFRGLIWNTVLACVNSLFIFLGKDTTKEIFIENEHVEQQGLLTSWSSNTTSHQHHDYMLKAADWPKVETPTLESILAEVETLEATHA